MSSMEKLAATAPKLLPAVMPVIEEAAPVVLDGIATAAGGIIESSVRPCCNYGHWDLGRVPYREEAVLAARSEAT